MFKDFVCRLFGCSRECNSRLASVKRDLTYIYRYYGLRVDSGDVAVLSRKLREWCVPEFDIVLSVYDMKRVYSVVRDFMVRHGALTDWWRLRVVDSRYWVVDESTFLKVVEWDWTDVHRYLHDRFDCDDFAVYLKGRLAFEFGLNSVGVVYDISSSHAYNIVVLRGGDGGLVVKLFEPQSNSFIDGREVGSGIYKFKDVYVIL